MSVLRASQIQDPTGSPILNSTGGILQVVSTFMPTTFTITNTLIANGGAVIPGLAVVITPTIPTSKMLLITTINCDSTGTNTQAYFWLARGASKIGAGNSEGSRVAIGSRFYYNDNNVSGMVMMTYLDSPSTSSPITYNVYTGTESTGSVVINRTINDTDNTTNGARSSSSLTVMEVAA